MITFSELIRPNSGKSSSRYVGIFSLYALILMGAVVILLSWLGIEIPKNNAGILESIAYTLGAVVVGVFVKTAFEKKVEPQKIE